MSKYYHAGYASVFEKYLFLVIENGILKSNYTIHNLDVYDYEINEEIHMYPKKGSNWIYNEMPNNFLLQGLSLIARVDSLNKAAKPWQMCEAGIYLLYPKNLLQKKV